MTWHCGSESGKGESRIENTRLTRLGRIKSTFQNEAMTMAVKGAGAIDWLWLYPLVDSPMGHREKNQENQNMIRSGA